MSAMEPGRRPRVLFVAEAVTLAHVARPLVLARSLDPARYEVIFASEPRYAALRGDLPFEVRPIRSIGPEQFLGALARGRPVYDEATLDAYVADDSRLLAEVRPDVVVGDFRLTLSASARLKNTPYVAICNAYWSPYAEERYPTPEYPLTRLLGVGIGDWLFQRVWRTAFAGHARPLDRVRRRHGLPALGPDLRRTYTDADFTLYADVPELVPTSGLPPNHRYIGPIVWSPAVDLPPWWDDLPADWPIVYATLGSSGGSGLLPRVFEALADRPLTVIAASAGRIGKGPIPANVRMAPFLPGDLASARSAVVICNGGSPTSHQALAALAPVVGLAGNLDQHLNMRGIVARGAGLLVRSEQAKPEAIRSAVDRVLADPSYRIAAEGVAVDFARYAAPTRFRAVLDEIIGRAPRP